MLCYTSPYIICDQEQICTQSTRIHHFMLVSCKMNPTLGLGFNTNTHKVLLCRRFVKHVSWTWSFHVSARVILRLTANESDAIRDIVPPMVGSPVAIVFERQLPLGSLRSWVFALGSSSFSLFRPSSISSNLGLTVCTWCTYRGYCRCSYTSSTNGRVAEGSPYSTVAY